MEFTTEMFLQDLRHPNLSTLRLALPILGPDRVRRGMKAITARAAGYACATCFVGEAFGGTLEGYREGINNPNLEIALAARICERYYESVVWGVEDPRTVLLEQCIIFLAESGTTIEPAPVQEPAAV